MSFDFDCMIDRCHSDSAKWCRYDNDILPLWVADMDFLSPAPVLRALEERVAHGVFGYGTPAEEFREIVQERLLQLYDWHVALEEILLLPGVIAGFNLACRAAGAPGDQVLVEVPVYPPMLRAPGNSGQSCQVVPLVADRQRYNHDFDAFEQAITERTSLFLLCNPHNPVGRVFEASELERLAEICLRHDIVICSDEIHCDILFDGRPHVPVASLAPEISARTITLMAPSKTYNIAGLHCSLAVIQNPDLRASYERARKDLVSTPNTLGTLAGLVAYRDGQPWLDALLQYLEGNRDYLLETLAARMPSLRCKVPEGTFLAWLDCREANLPDNPHTFFLEQARVALNDGCAFGAGGEGFVRLNFGCPRDTLAEALERMACVL